MVDCAVNFIEPLNLECWLVNTFAGSTDIFIFVSLIAIASIGAFFRMMNTVMLLMFALFAIIMAQYTSGIYYLVVLIGGIFSAWSISKIVKG